MVTRKRLGLLATCLLLTAGAPAVHAQWAVIDVGAIAQLVEQIATMYQQLETARSTLRQAEQQYRATTGGRGMERLLSGTDRNYLPANWAQLEATMRRADGTYRALGAQLQSVLNDNALLSDERVDLTSLQTFQQRGRRIKTNKLLLSCQPHLLQCQQHSHRTGFIRGEDAVRFA